MTSIADRLLLAALLAMTASASGIAAAQNDDFFENKIRPILANNCFACHTTSALGGLRLDSREGLIKGGSRGSAIAPGDPEKSLLIHAVRQDGDLKMPKGGKLSATEVADLTEWVKAGAQWPQTAAAVKFTATPTIAERRNFWSFAPLRSQSPPSVKKPAWVRNDIDKFILSKLDEKGLTPVAAADPRTLLRRLYLDLTGLPPTPEEVEAFAKDPSQQAYAKVVDRLLASPQYGERWGRHWLDVARFGEDDMRGLARKGYEPYDNAYLYRDWVIRAFNDDMPFDLFLKAQLAGDQLDENLRAKMLPALGFLGLGPWYYDTNEPPIARADERHERVDAITRSMLGLTVGCARCHDHKYDPITNKDYYAIAGVIGDVVYHEYPLAPKKVVERWDEENKKTKDIEKMSTDFSQNASTELAEVLALKSDKYMVAAWNVAGEPKKSVAQAAADAKLDEEVLERWVEFLAKPPLYYPNLKSWQAMIASGGTVEAAQKLAREFKELLMGIMLEKRAADEKNNKIIAKGMPLDAKPSVILPNDFKSFFDRPQFDLTNLNVDRLNLWTDVFQRDLSAPETADPTQGRPGLLVFRGFSLERQLSPEWNAHINALRQEIEERRKAMPQYPFVQGVMDVTEPKDIQIHLRGSPYNLGDPVPRRFLEVLSEGDPQPFTKGSGRLELAESIVRTPITARVIANRVWKWHFGSGIVDTPSNFGQAGERPSHPELLEYLAKSLVDGGWSIKSLQRQILLSATYQLGSASDSKNMPQDPRDRLHWRFSRQRLDAEEIRDSMLKVAGNLDSTPGGPPAEIGDDKNYRRTVYGHVSRFKLDTFLQLFDFPSPTISSEGRNSTNVPVQRLYFLNSPFVYDQSAVLAKRIASEVGDENKIRRAYQLIYQRFPAAEEMQAALAFLKIDRERLAPKAGPPEAEPPSTAMTKPSSRKKENAAPADPWANYIRVLLSSNEFLYVN
jgi:mono/diheme cytochrome c family protein